MLKDFILPAGGHAAATCHLARTVCRRAEREVVTLARNEEVFADGQKYLNRLSDLLFVLARVYRAWTGDRKCFGKRTVQPGWMRNYKQETTGWTIL